MMTNKDRTLIMMANLKKEEVSKFMAALQKAKEDTEGAKAYAYLNPVCSRCQKTGHACLLMPDGIRCTWCRDSKRACPRLADFWITHIARRLGRSEAYVQDLYSQHGTSKRPGAAGGSSPSQASGSRLSKKVADSSREAAAILEEDEEADGNSESDTEDETSRKSRERIRVLPPHYKTKVSGRSPTRGTDHRVVGSTHIDSKSSEPESQRKEIELLKRRAEAAEGNFVALVGRVQDFRTSLRSEIRTMPLGVESNGFSSLSAAMETTIDDAGLYLRDISDALKQSRSNREIHYGKQTNAGKAKEGGSKESRTSVRQVRMRSPEVTDDNMQKRRKI